ncbi:hypothetical protein EJB05_45305, partial [Eragrostis curvula]
MALCLHRSSRARGERTTTAAAAAAASVLSDRITTKPKTPEQTIEAKKQRVAIVGAGPSGLAACKHLLARGFRPVVFDAGAAVGGVWRRTLASTRLQTPAAPYRFSDFPWPEDVVASEATFPRHDQVAAYMAAYARRFGVLERVRFSCTVLGASYVGAAEREVAAWERWSGNGEAFGDGTGEWHLTVRHDGVGVGDGESPSTQVRLVTLHCESQPLHEKRIRKSRADNMEAKQKRVAIVGAGPSGLAACKHLLARGFLPVVFDAGAAVGGVWRRTMASTRLQTPAAPYRFSDFPWPEDVASSFPRHDQVAAYMAAYAARFGVLERVRFGCTVLGASYVGATEREVAAWERWSGNGEAFGDGTGEWHLTVRHDGVGDGESPSTQIHKFDFLILCVGRYGVAKFPTFPDGRGPEAFHGRVLHSMEYSSMAHADAAELIRGKRVVVVGAGKSALDTAAQCAEANGRRYPCTLVYRSAHWMLDPQVARRVNFSPLISTRWAELMVHKPGEGLALSLLATILTPLLSIETFAEDFCVFLQRWLVMKLIENYYKAHIPMEKHGMVPDYNFARSALGWRVGTLPEGFYDKVDQGSIQLSKCGGSFSFCADGLVLDTNGERAVVVGADVVILATGYHPDAPLRGVFASPWFRDIVAAAASSNSNNAAVLPLYRQCVHPRIPQMAVVGYAESGTSIYPYEMMAKWVAHLLDGAVRLPGVADMERDVAEWARWGAWAQRSSGGFFSSRASTASRRGTTTSCAGTWATNPGGRRGSSMSGCSRTAPRTTPTSSEIQAGGDRARLED